MCHGGDDGRDVEELVVDVDECCDKDFKADAD